MVSVIFLSIFTVLTFLFGSKNYLFLFGSKNYLFLFGSKNYLYIYALLKANKLPVHLELKSAASKNSYYSF